MGGPKGGEGGRRGGGQTQKKCGVRRVEAPRVGPELWGRNGGTPKGWGFEPQKKGGGKKGGGPKGEGAQFSRFFFLLPPTFSFSVQRTAVRSGRRSIDHNIGLAKLAELKVVAKGSLTVDSVHDPVAFVSCLVLLDFVDSSPSLIICTLLYSQDLLLATFVGSFINPRLI